MVVGAVICGAPKCSIQPQLGLHRFRYKAVIGACCCPAVEVACRQPRRDVICARALRRGRHPAPVPSGLGVKTLRCKVGSPSTPSTMQPREFDKGIQQEKKAASMREWCDIGRPLLRFWLRLVPVRSAPHPPLGPLIRSPFCGCQSPMRGPA